MESNLRLEPMFRATLHPVDAEVLKAGVIAGRLIAHLLGKNR